MRAPRSHMLLSDSPTHPEFWHVPDRRIRTHAAARQAAEIVEGISSRQDESDDTALFTALHTCAYRAARAARRGPKAADEQETWAGRWHTIREHLVKKHLGLAYSILGRFDAHDWDEDDRLSEAMYILARAVERFNPWRGFRFSTYAYNAIVRALMRRLRRERRYRRLVPLQHDTLLERPMKEHSFHAELYAERLKRVVEGNLAGLTELEATIIARRFPQGRGHSLTFQQIGNDVGLSKERVRQVQNIALEKLRASLEADPILR
jgi:RNA polymerase sigma factor (sigma-70 family)